MEYGHPKLLIWSLETNQSNTSLYITELTLNPVFESAGSDAELSHTYLDLSECNLFFIIIIEQISV